MALSEWVVLCSIYEVCDKDMCCEGGGMLREPWWRQTAVQKQLRATLKEILMAARERRKEPVRNGKGGRRG